MQKLSLFVATGFLLFVSPAFGEVNVTGRASLLHTVVDFGYVGSVNTTTDSLTYSAIDDSYLTRQGSATDGGPLGDVSWDATYQFNLEQQFVPDVSGGFAGVGSTGLFTFVGGEGVSYVTSTNRLEVDFENTTSSFFDLGIILSPFSRLELQQETSPGVWEILYSHPGGTDETHIALPLAAREYRLAAEAVVNTDNGFSNGGNWSFALTAVPEPSSWTLFAVGVACVGLLRRRATAPK